MLRYQTNVMYSGELKYDNPYHLKHTKTSKSTNNISKSQFSGANIPSGGA